MASRTLNTILSLQDNVSQRLTRVSSNFSNLSRQAQTATLSAQRSLNNLGKGIENTVTKAAKLGSKALFAGITAIGGYSIMAGSEFEKSMSKVKALSGATGEDFEKLSEKAKEMGANTSKSASESADALGYMALAGWNTEQMLTGIEPILRASEAGEMDLATCSDLVTDSMSAMGIQVDDLGHYLDVVAKAQASSNTSMQGLLEAYIGCGGTLKNMNVSVEESATLLGTLANRGKKGSEAGNALNSILVNLMGASGQASEALDSLGVSMYNSDGSSKGVTNTLKDLSVALSGCTQEQRDQFEAMIGGKTQMDTLQALLSGVNEEYGDLNGKLNDCNGYMTEAAKTMQDNLRGKFTTLKSAIEGVGISLYEGLQGPLKSVIDKVIEKVQQFQNKLKELKENGTLEQISNNITNALSTAYNVISKFINFIIEHKDIIVTIGSMAVAFTLVSKAIRGVSMAIKAFQVVWAILNGTIMLSPISWIILGITALVGVLVLAYQKSERFRNVVNTAFTKVKDVVVSVATKIGEKIQEINRWLQEHQAFIDSVKAVVIAILETIVNFIAETIENICTIVGGIIDYISGIIKIIDGIFKGDWTQVWEGCKEVVRGAVEFAKGLWQEVIDLLKTPVDFVINIFKKDQSGEASFTNATDSRVVKEGADGNATGTNYFGGGWTWVGEHGKELMKLPRGTQIKTNSQSNNMVNSSSNIPPITIIVQGNMIGNEEYADYLGNHIVSKVKLALNNM